MTKLSLVLTTTCILVLSVSLHSLPWNGDAYFASLLVLSQRQRNTHPDPDKRSGPEAWGWGTIVILHHLVNPLLLRLVLLLDVRLPRLKVAVAVMHQNLGLLHLLPRPLPSSVWSKNNIL
jgi:hypothetical protein